MPQNETSADAAEAASSIARSSMLTPEEINDLRDIHEQPTNREFCTDLGANSTHGNHDKSYPISARNRPSGMSARKDIICRPSVNPYTPLGRIVHGTSGSLAAFKPPPTTTLITDAIYALLLHRTMVVFATHGLNAKGLLYFILTFAPLHVTSFYLLHDHDRNFAKSDIMHTIYSGARLCILFGACFTAPGAFNVVDSTWRVFGGFILAGRGAHVLTHIIVGASERAGAVRVWWLISVRAAVILVPCILWAASLGLGDDSIFERDVIWGAATAIDQACVIGLGLAEAWIEKQDTKRYGRGVPSRLAIVEQSLYENRIGAFTSLIIATGAILLFETKTAVGSPDNVSAIPFYPRSLMCAIGGIIILYAMDRTYIRVNQYISVDTTAHSSTHRVAATLPHPSTQPAEAIRKSHTIRIFIRTYAHLPLHLLVFIIMYSLGQTLSTLYVRIREAPSFIYILPPNPPLLSAAIAAQYTASSARQYLDASNKSLPYAGTLFMTNPVTGGTSKLSAERLWKAEGVLSVSMSLWILFLAFIGILRPFGRIGRRECAGFFGRLLVAVGFCVMGLVDAGPLAMLIVIAALLVLMTLIGDACNPEG